MQPAHGPELRRPTVGSVGRKRPIRFVSGQRDVSSCLLMRGDTL